MTGRSRRATLSSDGARAIPKPRLSRDWEAELAAELWVARRRGRQKLCRFSEELVTPQAFADPRLARALAITHRE
jgi:hypothetical protein